MTPVQDKATTECTRPSVVVPPLGVPYVSQAIRHRNVPVVMGASRERVRNLR